MAKNYGNKYDAYYVALGTPLEDDGFTINYEEFRKHVKHFTDCKDFIEIGGGIIVLPEAGEIFTFDREEKEKLIKIAVEEGKGKLPVLSGVFANNTKVTVEEAEMARDLGVDGLFIMPPGGSIDLTSSLDKRANPYAFLNLAQAIAEKVDLPFVAHGAGSIDPKYLSCYPLETTMKIVKECPNFVGWKMMYPAASYIEVAEALREYEKNGGQHVGILCASAGLYFDAMTNDIIDGAVSCHWNYSRDENIALIKAYKAGDFKKMQDLWINGGLRAVHNAATGDMGTGFRLHTNFKTLTWLTGNFKNPFVREPMVAAFKSEIIRYRDLLRKYNWPCISDEEINKVLERLPR